VGAVLATSGRPISQHSGSSGLAGYRDTVAVGVNLSLAGATKRFLLLPALAFFVAPASAQVAMENMSIAPEISARKIFLMLFLMLGPIKILVPFVRMTKGADAVLRMRLATRSILFSAAALMLAGLLGRSMMENFNVSLPVLMLTGGVVLFLIALQTVLNQALPIGADDREADVEPGLRLAFSPLAFPTIVTSYGIAAVIVFATLVRDDHAAELMVAGIVVAILIMNWLAMLFAGVILKWVGTALQVFAVVLGVAQVALGLQIILHSLAMIGIFAERTH
jgi:multiple antibiotic resistance protein